MGFNYHQVRDIDEQKPVPLHELVLNYKMDIDRVDQKLVTPFSRVCLIISLSMDYAELLKGNPEISTNDIEVWAALTTKYLQRIEA